MAQTREVIAYDHPSNVGGIFTVSVVKVIDETFAEVRVWYGRPSPTGWTMAGVGWLHIQGQAI